LKRYLLQIESLFYTTGGASGQGRRDAQKGSAVNAPFWYLLSPSEQRISGQEKDFSSLRSSKRQKSTCYEPLSFTRKRYPI